MKKIVLIAAAAGLISLAACNKPTDAGANNEAAVTAMDNTAGTIDDTANATSNDTITNALDTAPDAGNATTNAQ